MTNPTALRRSFMTTRTFDGTPTEVFPLLCPVREYDWIPEWSCSMIFSDSGIAEHGCIFTTGSAETEETWVTTSYAPPTSIEYTRYRHDLWVAMLAITLEPSRAAQTSARVTLTITALTPAGTSALERVDPLDHERVWTRLEADANHYLRTGTIATRTVAP